MLAAKITDQHVVEALLRSPVAKEAADRHVKALAARRVMLARDRAALEEAAVADFHRHQDALAKAIAEHAAVAEALRAVTVTVGNLHALRSGESARFNYRMEAIEHELRETADPAIGTFIAEMHSEWERARKTPAPPQEVERNPNTGTLKAKSGEPLRVRPSDRIQAIREAIAAAEGLKLEPAQADVAAGLEALRAGLPTIGAIAESAR